MSKSRRFLRIPMNINESYIGNFAYSAYYMMSMGVQERLNLLESTKTLKFHYGNINVKTYLETVAAHFKPEPEWFPGFWLCKKIAAIPMACGILIIGLVNDVAKMVLGVFITPCDKKQYLKTYCYLIARDFQRAWGHAVCVIDETHGKYHIEESLCHKNLYLYSLYGIPDKGPQRFAKVTTVSERKTMKPQELFSIMQNWTDEEWNLFDYSKLNVEQTMYLFPLDVNDPKIVNMKKLNNKNFGAVLEEFRQRAACKEDNEHRFDMYRSYFDVYGVKDVNRLHLFDFSALSDTQIIEIGEKIKLQSKENAKYTDRFSTEQKGILIEKDSTFEAFLK